MLLLEKQRSLNLSILQIAALTGTSRVSNSRIRVDSVEYCANINQRRGYNAGKRNTFCACEFAAVSLRSNEFTIRRKASKFSAWYKAASSHVPNGVKTGSLGSFKCECKSVTLQMLAKPNKNVNK